MKLIEITMTDILRGKRKIVLTLTSIILCLILNTAASACLCSNEPSIKKEFKSSSNVFIAKFEAAEKSAAAVEAGTKNVGNPYNYEGYKFIVKKVYKGDLKIGDEIFFKMPRDLTGCHKLFNTADIKAEHLFFYESIGSEKILALPFSCSNSGGLLKNLKARYLKVLEKQSAKASKKPAV